VSELVITTARPGLLVGFARGRRAYLAEGEPGTLLARWRARMAYAGYACTPELAEIGEPLGYSVEPLDDELRARRAIVAAADEGPAAPEMKSLDAWLALARAGAAWVNASQPGQAVWASIEQIHDGPFCHVDRAYLLATLAPTPRSVQMLIFSSAENRDELAKHVFGSAAPAEAIVRANAIRHISIAVDEVSAAVRADYLAAFGSPYCVHPFLRLGGTKIARLSPTAAEAVAGIVAAFAQYAGSRTQGPTTLVIADRTITTKLLVTHTALEVDRERPSGRFAT
jgi:hypothetical protein